MSLFKKKIIQIISRLSEKDFDGALPYLMLTSKSESVVRDLLAFRLHKQFKGKNYAVAREWSRTDIAVLAPALRGKTKQFEDPKAIIEIKMVAAPAKGVSKTFNSLMSQLKDRRSSWPNAECFGLMAVRVCPGMSDRNTKAFDEVILYRKDLLKPLVDLEKTVHKLAGRKEFSSIKRGILKCGKERYLQAAVNLQWWLFVLH